MKLGLNRWIRAHLFPFQCLVEKSVDKIILWRSRTITLHFFFLNNLHFSKMCQWVFDLFFSEPKQLLLSQKLDFQKALKLDSKKILARKVRIGNRSQKVIKRFLIGWLIKKIEAINLNLVTKTFNFHFILFKRTLRQILTSGLILWN